MTSFLLLTALLSFSKDRLSISPGSFLEKEYQNAPWIRDPFNPDENIFRLSATISDRKAYINGKWYLLGETVHGYSIKEIEGKQVVLIRRGERLVIHMGGEK